MNRQLHLLHRTGKPLTYTLSEDLANVLVRLRQCPEGLVTIKTHFGDVDIRPADFSVISGERAALGSER